MKKNGNQKEHIERIGMFAEETKRCGNIFPRLQHDFDWTSNKNEGILKKNISVFYTRIWHTPVKSMLFMVTDA